MDPSQNNCLVINSSFSTGLKESLLMVMALKPGWLHFGSTLPHNHQSQACTKSRQVCGFLTNRTTRQETTQVSVLQPTSLMDTKNVAIQTVKKLIGEKSTIKAHQVTSMSTSVKKSQTARLLTLSATKVPPIKSFTTSIRDGTVFANASLSGG